MSEDSNNPLLPENEGPEPASTPQASPQVETGQPTGGEDVFSDLRSELVSDQGKVDKTKKQGFFSRLFGRKDEPKKQAPAETARNEPLVAPNKAERTTPLYEAPDGSDLPVETGQAGEGHSSGAFEVYKGFEEIEDLSPIEPHLGGGAVTGTTPLLDLNDLEITDGPANPEAGASPFTFDEGDLTDGADSPTPTPPHEGEEPSPEWKSFLARFWKPKDEDSEAARYRMADSQVESRLGGGTSEGPDDAWLRKQREDKQKPAVYKTLEGETPQIDPNWLDEMRAADAGQNPPAEGKPPISDVSVEDDWLDEMRISGEGLETAGPDQPGQPAVTPEEDWLVSLRRENEARETDNPPVAPLEGDWPVDARSEQQPPNNLPKTMPLIPDGDWFAEVAPDDNQALENRLESNVLPEIEPTQPPKASKNIDPFDVPLFFEEPPDPIRPAAGPRSHALEFGDPAFPVLPMALASQDDDDEVPSERLNMLGETLDQQGRVVEQKPEEPKGPSYSERYASIFAEAEEEATPEKVTEMRSEVLEGYEAPETPPEALQPAAPLTRRQKFTEWFFSRSMALQVLLVVITVLVMLCVVIVPLSAIRSGWFAPKLAVVPVVTPTIPKNQPYPTGVRLPGGWYFVVSPGSIKADGVWAPTAGEWLIGTELRRIIGLPWSRQTEAVFQSMQPGDEIEVQLNNGDKVFYDIKKVQQVSDGDVSVFKGQTPSLVLVLFNQDANNRWAAIADLKQEQ